MFNSSDKFNANGWRIACVKDGSAYLISTGSPECMCIDSSGTAGTNCSSWEATDGVPKHIANLNSKALTYCNSTYAYESKCDSNSAWNMTSNDFKNITGKNMSSSSSSSSSIINNGGHYWFASDCTSSTPKACIWSKSAVDGNNSSSLNGIRPVLRIRSSVIVTGGSGTYKDPYTIQ